MNFKEFVLTRALLEARSRAGLPQKEVARRMRTTQAVIARLESGGSRPSRRTRRVLRRPRGAVCGLSSSLIRRVPEKAPEGNQAPTRDPLPNRRQKGAQVCHLAGGSETSRLHGTFVHPDRTAERGFVSRAGGLIGDFGDLQNHPQWRLNPPRAPQPGFHSLPRRSGRERVKGYR